MSHTTATLLLEALPLLLLFSIFARNREEGIQLYILLLDNPKQKGDLYFHLAADTSSLGYYQTRSYPFVAPNGLNLLACVALIL